MVFANMRIATAALGVALLWSTTGDVLAQSDPKVGRPQATEADAKKDAQRKFNVYAEAAKLLSGPASQPECIWLGGRVVSRMWHDDLDTAFRHLDLYDRFGCPAGHIPAAFRCLLRQGDSIDPKQKETLQGRVDACWVNPDLEPNPAPPASASAPSGTTNR
jgi:hypothetical protein